MKRKILFLLCILPYCLFAQQKHTLSGYIYEKGSMESLPAVTIYLPDYNAAASSNSYGFYSITYSATDSVTVIYSYMGFAVDTVRLASVPNLSFNKLMDRTIKLRTVSVSAEKKSTEVAQMSTHTISALEIKSIPMLFGEKDLFKTLILMPGVSSGTEGTSGIFVRGGTPDQNLIILDEATIYNASHLLGFFSIFNGNAIKSAELIKGGFPARYGGRLSSVIDVTMKEGNKQTYHGEGGVGILSGHFMVEGPIVKNKSSFMVSGRRTWFDLLMRPVMAAIQPDFSAGYYFYDLNAKLNYDFGDKNKLYVSGYFGRDKFSMTHKTDDWEYKSKYTAGLYWQNGLAAIRWNHMFFNKLFSNLSFIFSDYKMNIFQIHNTQFNGFKNQLTYDFTSGIRDYTLKYDMTYIPNSMNTILMGVLVTYHEARPNAVQLNDDGRKFKNTTLAPGLEYALYLEDQINIKNKLRINPGFRLNFFSVPQKTYVAPEPRLSISYNLRKDLAMKASYAMMNQYMLLLSPTTVGLPTDLWVPVTKNIRPQRSQQVALGLVYEPKKTMMTFSVEGYYKKMDHIIAYLPGASFLNDLSDAMGGNFNETGNLDWDSKVTTGQAWAYGVEFLARKSMGKFTGWVAYTLSWAQQQFDELNYGKKFWARYDRRHDVSIVLMYSPTKRINLSLSWVYATGNALTLPTESYQIQSISNILERYGQMQSGDQDTHTWFMYAENFGTKNDFRMEAFHHLDIAVQFIKPHKKNKRFESIFEVSVYNVYNHKNPFMYMVMSAGYTQEKLVRRLAKITIFPIIPSFTYSFRF
ncbi:MAG: TonB-dependent receptor [Bacteroidetes bacterium]|nr:TonB-dependent receptor [Bacteroidota bacterium]MCL2303139.1 TonB-dependent receptor [Lentimicrobiaceae bacterium]